MLLRIKMVSIGYVPTTHKVTLGKIVELLDEFKNQPQSLVIPEIPEGSFAKKLYSTYLSYLPKEKAIFPLKMNEDDRGSFTELLKTENVDNFLSIFLNQGLRRVNIGITANGNFLSLYQVMD